MSNIIFVGDEPSKANLNVDVPFVGTKSYGTLLDWMRQLEIDVSKVILANRGQVLATGEIFTGSVEFIYVQDAGDQFVALGRRAADHLAKLGFDYLELPHPSGLNRKLNDKAALEEQLASVKQNLLSRVKGEEI